MSTKKWKNKRLSKLMTEKYGFKMNLGKLNENVQETLEEAEELDESKCSEGEMEEDSCKPGAHEGMDEAQSRGYINDKGEFLPLGTPEADAFEQEMRNSKSAGFNQDEFSTRRYG